MRKVQSWILIGLTLAGAHGAVAKDRHDAKPAPKAEAAVAEVQQAIDEQRLLDADMILTQALMSGSKDPRLTLLDGELDLLRGRYPEAAATMKGLENTPEVQARALQDEGIALSLMGRSDQALAILQRAVAKDPSAWRAWNALGSEYDQRSQWSNAEQAYQHAITASSGAAIALNNRGYSRLLQHRRDDAVADLVAALRKKPDLAEARTNLRLALAMGGDYDRAIAGGAPADEAALLNNAGFAAAMRGDYAHAEDLLNRALKVKGEYYGRASENLKIVEALSAQSKKAAIAAP
jgi:Flp pilus assembly protein TadD